MKRNLILVFLIISYLGFSQQVLKKITDTGDYTIVDLYSFRNGTDNTTSIGAENFNGFNSLQYNFKFTFWDSNITVFLAFIEPTLFFSNPISFPSLPSPITQIICSTNINFYNNNNTIFYGANGFEYGSPNNSMAVYPYPFPLMNSKIFHQHADTNGDGGIDCYSYQVNIPKKMTNGNLIPTTTLWCRIDAIKPSYYCSGNSGPLCELQCPGIYFKFNGTTWVEQVVNWNGNPISTLQEVVCNPLSIYENQILNKKISIYPNPTESYIFIQNKESKTENFAYSIIDLTGRIVKNGKSKFSEEINIESLASSNYIIQIETESGEKLVEKLIKN